MVGFLQYCMAATQRSMEERAYMLYVADSLQAIANNTAPLAKKGVKMSKRYIDIITPKKDEKEDAYAIIEGVVNRAGIKVI